MNYMQYLTKKSMNESIASIGKPLAAILRRSRATKDALVHESPEAASIARRITNRGGDDLADMAKSKPKNNPTKSKTHPVRKAIAGTAVAAASVGAGMLLNKMMGAGDDDGASYEDGSPIARETSGDNVRPWPENLAKPLGNDGAELLNDDQIRLIDAIAYFLPTSEFDQNTKALLSKAGPWNDEIAQAAELRLIQAQNMWDDMIEYGSEAAVQRQDSKGRIVTPEEDEDEDEDEEIEDTENKNDR